MAKTYDIPIPQSQNVSWCKLLTADTSMEAPSANGALAFTAGAEGSKVDQITLVSLGTNVATQLRLFINDGQGVAPTNFSFVHPVSVPSTTAGTVIDITIPKNSTETAVPIPYLEPNQKIYASLGTTVAAGFMLTTWGADY